MIKNIVKKSWYMFILARVNSGESRVQHGGVRAARIIRRSQDEPCVVPQLFSNIFKFEVKILLKLNLKLIHLMYEWNPAFEFQ